MPGGWDSYRQAVAADNPIAWYGFNELLAGQPVTAGSQDPQSICFDGSAQGNLNAVIQVHANNLAYGTAVVSNTGSLLNTNGPGQDSGGAALFPSTTVTSNAFIIAGASNPNVASYTTLQPTAAMTVEAWCKPAVFNTTTKQVLVAYGSDSAQLSAYNLFHTGGSATTHTFAFAINIGAALKTATATLPNLVANTVYHVVGTYDGINVRVYVNGVLQGTTAATGSISYGNLQNLALAFGNDPSLTDANLQGSLDEVAIYSYALSATRIAYHFRQGSVFLPFPWSH